MALAEHIHLPRLANFFILLPRCAWAASRFLTFCSLSVLLSFSASGIDRDRKFDQLYHTAWSFKDGAPGEVRALAQTTDGYLWLGTASGLFRFDGLRFQRYQPPSGQDFQQGSIYSLLATPDGGLWVGYWYGGASLIKNGKVTNYGQQQGLPQKAVLAFARDRHGTIWIAAGGDGLARLEGTHWRRIGADWGLTERVNTVFVGHNGTIWVGTPTRVWYLAEGATHFQIGAENLQYVSKFAESPDGTLWMAETTRGVRPVPLAPDDNSSRTSEIAVGSQSIAFDEHGALWIATIGDGVIRSPYPERLGPSKVDKSDARLELRTQRTGLTADYVVCLLLDHEGNIWFGTSTGLDQFRQSPIVSLPSPGGSLISALVPGNNGSLWIASVGENYLTQLERDEISFQSKGLYFDCGYRGPNGVIWLAAPGWLIRLDEEGVHPSGSNSPAVSYRYHGIGRYQVIAEQRKFAKLRLLTLPPHSDAVLSFQTRAKAMTSDESGRLWISTQTGTFRLEQSGWTSFESIGGPQGSAASEFTDSEGRIWFGFKNKVARLEAGKVTVFPDYEAQDGTTEFIQEEGSKIWAGGDRTGLRYFDGSRFQPIEPPEGGAFGSIFGMIADPGRGLWLASSQGVIFIADSELQHVTTNRRVAWTLFGALDGLTEALTKSGPSVARTSDGRIWFATTKGLAWIDPSRIPINTVPPPVVIESLVTNKKQYDTAAFLQLPAQTKDLQIAYTATSLTIPERVRFRYKLDGKDKEWQEPGTRREAVYTNLKPGPHRFHVIAANNDGVWNEAGASFDFSIAPAYYQTTWFSALCGVSVLAVLWALYQLRLRQLERQFAIGLEARVNERTRIARELHDTLLQSLHGLMFQFQAARNLMPVKPDRGMQSLDDAIGETERALAESRDAIQGLRSEPVTKENLAELISASGSELGVSEISSLGTPAFHVIEEGERQTLSPRSKNEICRIVVELLRNAYRHANATRIEVEIRYDDRWLRLRIRDNGVGIDPRVLKEGGRPGHWGLRGIRERAERIGAKLDFWSETGAGTEVQLAIRASLAYQTPREKLWSRWFRKSVNRAEWS